MNLPGCAVGPSVGPSQVVTGAVDDATSACAAASASPPVCAAMTGAAMVIGCAAAEALSSCVNPPTPSAVPNVNAVRFRKPLRVEGIPPSYRPEHSVQMSFSRHVSPHHVVAHNRLTPILQPPLSR